MPMTRTPLPSAEGLVLTVHRLDLPQELAEILAREARDNERSLPAQIRFALKQWLSSRGAG